MQGAKILLVDDDADILEFMTYNLQKEGFVVNAVQNSAEAIEIAEKFEPNLIILDVMMPDVDGFELCESLRENPRLKHSLITFLTARGEDYSQIAGFDAGADDYITKPIKPKLLISRVKALLKRHSTERNEWSNNILEFKDLSINKETYLVSVKGQNVHLPKKEFDILCFLAASPGRVFQREEIYTNVWGTDVVVGDRTIDVHIRKLREALGNERIQTVKGVGYKFID